MRPKPAPITLMRPLYTGGAEAAPCRAGENVPGRRAHSFLRSRTGARTTSKGILTLPHSGRCELADRGNGIREGSTDCRMVTLQTDGSQGDSQAGSSGDLDCSDFATQEEPHVVIDDDPAHPNGPDGEPEDGLACESLPDR